ncbi:MAG: M24 family metallopeptidase, partial [Bacillota bacterium]|nr:M24 family metallopeptidase [Bacillota bacterium]
LEIHEIPRYSQAYNDVIKENSIVSIEPGIYLPGKFGVRIEDLALVTKNGIINFVTAPKELLII